MVSVGLRGGHHRTAAALTQPRDLARARTAGCCCVVQTGREGSHPPQARSHWQGRPRAATARRVRIPYAGPFALDAIFVLLSFGKYF